MYKDAYLENIHSYNCITGTREIFLHGYQDYHGDDPGTDYRMSSNFIKNLRFLECKSDQPIIIHQQNIGGCWESGMAVFDVIKNSSCYIIVVMHGEAISMGSLIPQAADLRIIMPHCTFMIHEGYLDTSGTMRQSNSLLEFYNKATDIMVDIYTEKCQNSPFFKNKYDNPKYVRRFLLNKLKSKEDWYLSGYEAVEYGFADSVLGEDYKTLEEVRKIK